jgi:hypothetical protein
MAVVDMCVCVLSPRVLMEEYGTGRYAKKHSTFYKVMMEELGLHTSEFELHCYILAWAMHGGHAAVQLPAPPAHFS